jgi:S-layer homology domain
MYLISRTLSIYVMIAALTACSHGAQSAGSTPSPSAEASAAGTLAPSPATGTEAPSPAASASEAAVQSQSPTASGSPAITVAYTDVNGIFAEQAIRDEAKLGVFDSTTGEFKPNEPITRGEFVKWLVTLNNIYFSDDSSKQFRMPETAEVSFEDVPQSSPYWKYVQALVDAGFVIGVDPKHFAPDRLLTRQEMVAIKFQVDVGTKATPNPADTAASLSEFVDKDQVSKLYITAILGDLHDGGTGNIDRVWGKTVYLHPTRPVTRSEAAVSLFDIAGRKASDASVGAQ